MSVRASLCLQTTCSYTQCMPIEREMADDTSETTLLLPKPDSRSNVNADLQVSVRTPVPRLFVHLCAILSICLSDPFSALFFAVLWMPQSGYL